MSLKSAAILLDTSVYDTPSSKTVHYFTDLQVATAVYNAKSGGAPNPTDTPSLLVEDVDSMSDFGTATLIDGDAIQTVTLMSASSTSTPTVTSTNGSNDSIDKRGIKYAMLFSTIAMASFVLQL